MDKKKIKPRREIRFRAWYPREKMMVMPNYVDGMGQIYEHRIGREPELIEGAIALEYTGQKDKNGREICEGDVLTLSSGQIGPVICEGAAFMIGVPNESIYLDDYSGFCTVVGNIYENPFDHLRKNQGYTIL